VKALSEAALAAGAWLCAGSVPERNGDDAPFNTILLFDPTGELRATHRKAHLYAPLGEDQAVTAGSATTVVETDVFGPVGLSICFDGDFPEVARAMRLRGARIVVQPSAYERAAERWWDVLYPANALANGQWWIMANQCGTNSSGTLLGGSQIISPMGHVVARASRALDGQTPPQELLLAELDLGREIKRADRQDSALWNLRRPELYRDR
jgi:predicted amidohydrolase